MDRAADHRGVPLERGTALPDPRSRRDLWRCCQAPNKAMGIRDKPISAGAPWQNCFAERLLARSAANALTTSWSSASSTCAGSCALMPIITMRREPMLIRKGCAPIASCSAARAHHISCARRRPTSPIRPNLSFRYTQGNHCVRAAWGGCR
jgi:hypothetical protein